MFKKLIQFIAELVLHKLLALNNVRLSDESQKKATMIMYFDMATRMQAMVWGAMLKDWQGSGRLKNTCRWRDG